MKLPAAKTAPRGRSPAFWPAACVCVFLVLAVLAVFGQTAGFGFVNYDDQANVYENPAVEKGLSGDAVGWAFTHAQVNNWIPLTTLSHMLDCQVFGLRAGGHHLANVLLHAANAVLLFLALRGLTGSFWRCAFAAALFAVHPLRAESVAWVSERKDVLSGLFFLLTIGAYVRQARRPRPGGHVPVIVFFALGLLAKSMVATLPLVLLLLDWWPLGRWRRWRDLPGLLREKIPLFALSAVSCLATALVPGLVVNARRPPFWERLGNALVSYVVYLRQMLFPAGLAASYPFPPNGQPMATVCLAFLVLAGISLGVWLCRKKRPFLLMGWLWYLVMLLPVIGIIQISKDAAHADRYTYLPGIGLAIAVTWALADWSAGWKFRRVVLGGLMTAVVAALMFCAMRQTWFWRDSETLWVRALACTASNAHAHLSLGAVYAQNGRTDEAIAQYQSALEIAPHDAEAHVNLGLVFFKSGRVDEAIVQYGAALSQAPESADARNKLGFALFTKGELDEAIAQYGKALETAPDNAEVRNNLGFALAKMGKTDEAIAQYNKSLESSPDNAGTLSNLGNALLGKGDVDGALSCFQKAAALNPAQAETWYNLGNCFLQNGDFDQAITSYLQALKINPRSADARANLGVALLAKGKIQAAMNSWEEALKINPNQVYVQNNLAWLLATTPDAALRNGKTAIALATQASQATGNSNPAMLHTLAAAYAETGSYGLAAATARRAQELAVAQRNNGLSAALQQEIKLYEAGSPVRDAPR